MQLLKNVILVAAVFVTTNAFISVAQAQSVLLGSSDRNSAVIEYKLANTGGGTAFTYESGQNRPRGIAYDKINDKVFVGQGPNNANGSIKIYGQYGASKGSFSAQVNISGTTSVLQNLDGMVYRNNKLYVTNAFVYGGTGTDNKIYVFDTTLANPIGTVFATLPTAVSSAAYLNGINFGADGNLYVVEQTGNSGSGTGYLRRFKGSTGAYIDTVASSGSMFGVTFDSAGNYYAGSGANIIKGTKTGTDGNGNSIFTTSTLISGLDTSMICDVYAATDGYLYVAALDRHSLFKVNETSGTLVNTTGNGYSDLKNDFLTEIYVVPEPSDIAFALAFGMGLVGGIAARRRK